MSISLDTLERQNRSDAINQQSPYDFMDNSNSAATRSPKKLVSTTFFDATLFNAVAAVAEAEMEVVPPI